MAAVYTRRFTFNPGNSILLNIESVNILDLEPPAAIVGIGTGVALLVGEFEDGPFNVSTQVGSPSDLQQNFGGLGFSYAGVPANYPCAIARKADGALSPEYWNGNAMAQLNGKQFAQLIVCRVDTHVGNVTFTPLAYITGAAQFAFTLSPSQVLQLSVDGGGPTSATFTAAAATITSSAQTFPDGFVGGETLTLGYDSQSNFVVTFLPGDTTQAAVIARINQYAGFAFAASVTGTTMSLTGVQQGTGGQIRVVASSAGSVLTQLGLTVANTAGTGNVANILAVKESEIKTIVEAAITGTLVETDQNGALRISNKNTPGTGTLAVSAGTTAAGLGFVIGTTSTAAVPTSGGIPSGTVVQNSGATRIFVTMQSIAFSPTGTTIAGVPVTGTTFTVPVRHAVDDGTGLSATAGTVTTVLVPPTGGAFGVVNAQTITAALTEAAIDAAYAIALGTPTQDINTVAKTVNLSWSARQSNAVRRALKQNVLSASANGCFGRVTCVRTPMGTTKAAAQSTTAEPGIGAYRDQRVIYNWPQASTFVPSIAQRGTSGGQGFTTNGIIDVGADGFCVSIMSQLPPEENPGQETAFTGGIVGLESSPNAQGMQMTDYISLKASGVCALRMDGGIAIFQSGVTSVDPLVNPNLTRISRRRMADFIQDSVAARAGAFGKKLSTFARRKAMAAEIRTFMDGLLGVATPSNQRIGGYTLDATSGNTPTTLGQGLFFIILNVQTLASLDSIVIQTQIGEQVQVTEVLPQAA